MGDRSPILLVTAISYADLAFLKLVDEFSTLVENAENMRAVEPVGNLRASSSIRRQRLFAYACMYAYNICLVYFYCCSQSPKLVANFDAVALLR